MSSLERNIAGARSPYGTRNRGETIMPLLIPVLIGIPVVLGGGWVIYHFVH
jgi:hypothetical protein